MQILFATDGSPHAAAAARLLEDWSLTASDRVTVVVVVPPVPLFSPELISPTSAGAADVPFILERETEKANRIAANAIAPFEQRGIATEWQVRYGDPAEEILKAAQAMHSDLVLLGARGLPRLAELLLGSVSQHVANHAPCPALVARDAASGGPLLLGVDGSTASEVAARFVAALPLPAKQECIVLHVVERGDADAAARRLVETAVAQLLGAGHPARGVVRRGHAAQEILRAATEFGAAVIAVGDRGHTGIREFLLGGVSERVLRYAPCSVLIARERESGG